RAAGAAAPDPTAGCSCGCGARRDSGARGGGDFRGTCDALVRRWQPGGGRHTISDRRGILAEAEPVHTLERPLTPSAVLYAGKRSGGRRTSTGDRVKLRTSPGKYRNGLPDQVFLCKPVRDIESIPANRRDSLWLCPLPPKMSYPSLTHTGKLGSLSAHVIDFCQA